MVDDGLESGQDHLVRSGISSLDRADVQLALKALLALAVSYGRSP